MVWLVCTVNWQATLFELQLTCPRRQVETCYLPSTKLSSQGAHSSSSQCASFPCAHVKSVPDAY
eukprot:326936-Pelagomonas_calceolata.AAC.3